mgnify:CR=1 FL=1
MKVDPELHAEVLERYAKLNLAPYKGFVNPVMKEVKNSNGEVTDIVLGLHGRLYRSDASLWP